MSAEKRVIAVTGGSGLVGRAICRRLAGDVHLAVGSRSLDRAAEAVTTLAREDSQTHLIAWEIDVNDAGSIAAAFDVISSRFGRLDVLVNCAGYSARGRYRPIHLQSVEVIDEILTMNLRGALLCAREAARRMIQQKAGRIISIGSAASRGCARHAEYSAAKAGLCGLTRSLALELGPWGITVNCVSPGVIPREPPNSDAAAYYRQTNCLRLVPTQDATARAVAFLASDAASFITGETLRVDGGRTLGLMGERLCTFPS